MLTSSQTAGSQIPVLVLDPAWRAAGGSVQPVQAPKLAVKDTIIAASVLSGYVDLYIGVGLASLSAVEWFWEYLKN